MEVLDKGKAAAVTSIIETRDKQSGNVIFENQMTVFIRGAGGFGGRRAGKGEVALKYTSQKINSFTVTSSKIVALLLLPMFRHKELRMLSWRRRRARHRLLSTGRHIMGCVLVLVHHIWM